MGTGALLTAILSRDSTDLIPVLPDLVTPQLARGCHNCAFKARAKNLHQITADYVQLIAHFRGTWNENVPLFAHNWR